MKKALALVLAILTLAFVFTGCTTIGADGKGAVIDIYMGTKTINLDPAIAYTDENSVKIINLIFEGLFTLDQSGNLKKALAKKYEIGEDRYGNKKMTVWLNDTYWSDGSMVQANDVVYAWKRILDPSFESGAASMLYAIQGRTPQDYGGMTGCRFAPRCEYGKDCPFRDRDEMLQRAPGCLCRCARQEGGIGA